MVLQQIGSLDNEDILQQPATVIKRVKKKNPSKIVLEDSVSDSSSDSLLIESTITAEDVPIQRPKRSKVQRQQKPSR